MRARIGVDAEVVTGDEEARLSFSGATLGLADVAGARVPYLVVDIGGGSTEFVLGGNGSPGELGGEVVAACSVDVGSVRITERRLTDDPPSPAQIDAATADIDAAVAAAGRSVDLTAAGCVVGVAGSVTTIAATVLGLSRYDRSAVHHAALSFDEVRATTRRLLEMPRAERAALPSIAPGRVDVIGAGGLVLDRVLAALPQLDSLIVSETDILDGIAVALAG